MAKTTVLRSTDTSRNFWEVNPGCLIFREFKDFYKSDRSVDKNNSSRIMWAITLYLKPTADLGHLPEDKRLSLINSDFLPDKLTLDPDNNHLNLIKCFEENLMTRLERIAKDWGDKLDERFQLLKEVRYDLTNAEELDKMMSRTEKLWQQYTTCLNDLETEEASAQVEGGAVESLNESGLI